MATIVSSGVTSTGVVLSGATWMYPDWMNVSKGGTANSTTVLENGRLYVSSGGLATDTVVNGGGLSVARGGSASGAAVHSGFLDVSSGAVMSAIRENGGWVGIAEGAEASFVPNTISNLTLDHRSATVHSGTTATDTALNLGGSMHVFSGGLATGAVVSGGSLVVSGGTAVAASVHSGGRFTVFSSGLASNAVVNVGGWLGVFSGGSVADALVHSGGSVTLFSGGYASALTLKAGAILGKFVLAEEHYWEEIPDGVAEIAPSVKITGNEMIVTSGGTATGTTIPSMAKLHVSSGGTATDAVLRSGNLIVSDGGIATGTVVSGGSVIVSSGGTAVNTAVNFSGSFIVSSGGTAIAAIIHSRGSLSVESGGYAGAVTLKSGARYGKFFFAEDHDIEEIQDGAGMLAPLVAMTESAVTVSSGGILNGTTVVSGGSVVVSSGGTANGTTVNDSCGMCVQGSANSTIIYNSLLTIASGGRVTTATILTYGVCHVSGGGMVTGAAVHTQGKLHVSSGGVASDATVHYNGNLLVSSGGTAVSATVNWEGFCMVSSGGMALGTTVNSAGALYVSSGGLALETTVFSGGALRVFSGGCASGVIVDCYGYGYDNCGLYVSSGGSISGTLQICSGSVVSACQEAKIDFTVAEQTAPEAALINNWSLIQGGSDAIYSITVKPDQTAGVYTLADGAENFNLSIAVKSTAGTRFGSLAVGETQTFGRKEYTLTKDAGALTLKIDVLPAVSDYNKSGMSDMIQFVDGKVYVMHDTDSGYVQTPPVNDVTGWNVTEIRRDLTGDGYADVQITAYDGASQTWVAMLRNDSSQTGCITLNYQFIGAYETELWSYLGSADFNADGKAEILMIQTDAGKDSCGHRNVAAWVTDESGQWVDNIWIGALDDNWDVAGTADVTGDGADNVILRRADGMIGYWDKAGTNNVVELQNAGNRLWLTTGDFDGDGAADFLWQTIGSDEFSVWSDVSGSLSDSAIGKVSDLGGNWTFAGVGDYNGDGKDEILWCDTTTYTTAYGEGNKANFAKLTVIA